MKDRPSTPFPPLQHLLQTLGYPAPGGIAASSGELFGDAFFGRDSAEVAEDLVPFDKVLPRRIIHDLVRYQGARTAERGDGSTEEEFGKIHHECRILPQDPLHSAQEDSRFREMWSHWGGVGRKLVYYGSVDATPLFVRLVVAYSATWGRDVLEDVIATDVGEYVTVREAVERAMVWIERKLDESSLGLVEFDRRNPHGIANQGWKDSMSAYLHEDGTLSNDRAPLASIEVQGLVYDALVGGAELVGNDDLRAAQWIARAEMLRNHVLEWFWIPEYRYFAQAIDRDPFGVPRLVRTMTSNAGVILRSRLFDRLPLRLRRKYVHPVAKRIVGEEFLTDAGIRCRALRYASLKRYYDYHGSCAVWPKETYDIACGLRHQGYPALARAVEIRLLNAINIAGHAMELFYVDAAGVVAYEVERTEEPVNFNERVGTRVFAGTNVPEGEQAWTVSAALAVKHRFGREPFPSPSSAAEAEILRRIPHVALLATREEVEDVRRKQPRILLNTSAGKSMSRLDNRRRNGVQPLEMWEMGA
ncbi:MAG: amylo-alpha-1,6-glucosidase [Candidatus Dormibacteria bacterium]